MKIQLNIDKDEYLTRLMSFIQLCCTRRGTSVAGLGRALNDEGFRYRVSQWKSSGLHKPIKREYYEQLARIDPLRRDADQLKAFLENRHRLTKRELLKALNDVPAGFK